MVETMEPGLEETIVPIKSSETEEASIGAQLVAARDVLKSAPTEENIRKWATVLEQWMKEQIRQGAHEVTLDLPAIAGSAGCARGAVRMLAEAANADPETVGNLEMLVTEFVDNELEHGLGLTDPSDTRRNPTTAMKPSISLAFRASIKPIGDGLAVEFIAEGQGGIPRIDDDRVYQKITTQFGNIDQVDTNEFVLRNPTPNNDNIDPLAEGGRGFFLLSRFLSEGTNAELRYKRLGQNHQAVLSEMIPKAA